MVEGGLDGAVALLAALIQGVQEPAAAGLTLGPGVGAPGVGDRLTLSASRMVSKDT